MDDIFEIEAPAPGSKFNVLTVHPDNYEVINSDDRARQLTRQEIKALRARKRELEPTYIKAREIYQTWRARQVAVEQRIAELKLIGEDDPHYSRAQQRIEALKEHHNKIQNRINRVKKPLVEMFHINQRWTEHKTALENERLYKRLRDEMAQEATKFAGLIVRVWDRLGYCHRVSHKGKMRKKSVRFERCIVTPDEIQLKIRSGGISLFGNSVDYLPEGVAVSDLIDLRTLTELTIACERFVKSTYSTAGAMGTRDNRKHVVNGAWIYIERLGLVDGLFNYIPLSVVMARYPNDKRTQFPLPLGVREGRKINWIKLLDHPHLMVNGLTGSGKSNVMHVVLTTLIQMHSPDEIRLVLIDLKEGAELVQYEACPHTIGGVISSPTRARDILGKLETLRQERMKAMRARGVFKIEEYNGSVRPDERMPHILCVIDEYISVGSKGRDIAAAINDYTIQLATKARAAGIHLFIGVQTPYSKTLPSEVKANITLVVGGRQRTQGASLSTFGSTEGTRIENNPGRMVVQAGPDTFQVQIPHATKENIVEAIERSKQYPQPRLLELPEVAGPEDPHELVIATAINVMDGELKAENIWRSLDGNGISRNQVREIVKEIAESESIQYSGNTYDIIRTRGNFFKLISSPPNQNGHIVAN